MDNTFSIEESRQISFVRVCAMFMIILTHYFGCFNVTAPLGQLLSVGVEIFFIISGFIFGHKNIDNPLSWFFKRMKRIIIPVYIYLAIMLVILYFTGNFGEFSGIGSTLISIFNLHGILQGGITTTLMVGHLWYVSFIMVCYIITPLLNKFKEKVKFSTVILFLSLCAIISSVFMVSHYNSLPTGVWVKITGIYCYIAAYFIGAQIHKPKQNYIYIYIYIYQRQCWSPSLSA